MVASPLSAPIRWEPVGAIVTGSSDIQAPLWYGTTAATRSATSRNSSSVVRPLAQAAAIASAAISPLVPRLWPIRARIVRPATAGAIPQMRGVLEPPSGGMAGPAGAGQDGLHINDGASAPQRSTPPMSSATARPGVTAQIPPSCYLPATANPCSGRRETTCGSRLRRTDRGHTRRGRVQHARRDSGSTVSCPPRDRRGLVHPRRGADHGSRPRTGHHRARRVRVRARDVPHTFSNQGPTHLRFLLICTPGRIRGLLPGDGGSDRWRTAGLPGDPGGRGPLWRVPRPGMEG